MLISEMDPPIINETSFSAANRSSYTLAEIWPFPINGTDSPGTAGGGLGLRMTGFGETTTNRDVSIEESTLTDQSGSRGAGKKRRDVNSEDGSSKLVSANINNANDLNHSSGKRLRVLGSNEEHGGSKAEVEASSGSGNKSTEQVKDYIHVRARRGQATDSYSLAERARREKISERTKILRDLVPGCNKVIGKVLVLDKTIDYIQSLQRQVEFLSMKLQTVNSRMDPTIEGFPTKNVNNEEPEDPQILLDSLLATMKENFQSFKVTSGEELGEELRVEVYKSLNDNEDKSFRICQPQRSLSQPKALENEREIMAPDTSDQQLVVKDAIHQDVNVFGPEIGGTTCINETSETEHEKTVNSISYEDLKQHFGRPLKDAAESLNVSRSTFKRLCRKHGIPRWQSHKRKTVDNSSSKIRRVGDEPSARELSCLDMPPTQATSPVAHTSRNVYLMTVKATYKDVIMRFELSPSSGMEELQENVTQRLRLEKENFSIKYQDEEGDWVLIACDNDLKTCMDISR